MVSLLAMAHDDISCLSLKNQTIDFPTHYHETYCISLIHKGIERLDLGEQTHYGEAGSITVTHPFEVHSQPVINADSRPGFDTIYISEDLIKFHLESPSPFYLERKINNEKASHLLMQLRDSIRNGQHDESILVQFLSVLNPYKTTPEERDQELEILPWLDEVKEFIENNLTAKINLEELAMIANLNKFGFSKTFKTHTGMSPMNFVLMQKVFAARESISADSNLTQIAYAFDFTDLAHFSNTFKRFVGISPGMYKSNLR